MSRCGSRGAEGVPGESAIALLARVLQQLSPEDGDALLVAMNNIRLVAEREARKTTFKEVVTVMGVKRDLYDRDEHNPFEKAAIYNKVVAWAEEQLMRPRYQFDVPESYVRAAIWLETKVRTLGGAT